MIALPGLFAQSSASRKREPGRRGSRWLQQGLRLRLRYAGRQQLRLRQLPDVAQGAQLTEYPRQRPCTESAMMTKAQVISGQGIVHDKNLHGADILIGSRRAFRRLAAPRTGVEMALLPILEFPDPRLRKVATPGDPISTTGCAPSSTTCSRPCTNPRALAWRRPRSMCTSVCSCSTCHRKRIVRMSS